MATSRWVLTLLYGARAIMTAAIEWVRDRNPELEPTAGEGVVPEKETDETTIVDAANAEEEL